MPKPRRPWFRFTLRTFFVLLTVFSVWLGVQMKWIRDRRDAKLWIEKHGYYSALEWERGTAAPLTLAVLGEKGVSHVWLYKSHSRSDKAREIRRLFPESYISVVRD